jgi:hypothetical protein
MLGRMAAPRQYQVVFDANLDIIDVKDCGPAEAVTRTVGIPAAKSVADAKAKAKILVGGGK